MEIYYSPQPIILLPIESFDYHISGRYLVDYQGEIREASYDFKEVAFRLLCKPEQKIPVTSIRAYSYLGQLDK